MVAIMVIALVSGPPVHDTVTRRGSPDPDDHRGGRSVSALEDEDLLRDHGTVNSNGIIWGHLSWVTIITELLTAIIRRTRRRSR
jgi:hypothetical protein